jgi:hypothetical protein
MARPATSRSLSSRSISGVFGSRNAAMTAALGTSSWSSPSCLPDKSVVVKITPVTLPPGRLRLATRPVLTGSAPVAKTIGVVAVAVLVAAAAVKPLATITATERRARSAANPGNRSTVSSAQ